MGKGSPWASTGGGIVPAGGFFDYNGKYRFEGSQPLIPAKITKKQMKEVQDMAVRAFQAVDGSGLARVDFLMDPKTRRIYLNEINTMPGFTSISMYPKLWAASGLGYQELIDRLIRLALERHQEKKSNPYRRSGARLGPL